MGRRTGRGNKEAYSKYVLGMIPGEDEVLKEAAESSRYAVGDEQFLKETEFDLNEARLEKSVKGGDIIWPERKKIGLQKVEQAVGRAFGVKAEELRSHGSRW